MQVVRATERSTPASGPDPRRSLGSALSLGSVLMLERGQRPPCLRRFRRRRVVVDEARQHAARSRRIPAVHKELALLPERSGRLVALRVARDNVAIPGLGLAVVAAGRVAA